MHIAPELGDSLYKITRYDERAFYINGQAHTQPCLLSPTLLIDPCPAPHITELSIAKLAPALLLKPQLLLVGTGLKLQTLSPELIVALQQQGIGVEVMQTPAACRTFNLLQEEGRMIIAAIWPPDYLG